MSSTFAFLSGIVAPSPDGELPSLSLKAGLAQLVPGWLSATPLRAE